MIVIGEAPLCRASLAMTAGLCPEGLMSDPRGRLEKVPDLKTGHHLRWDVRRYHLHRRRCGGDARWVSATVVAWLDWRLGCLQDGRIAHPKRETPTTMRDTPRRPGKHDP